MSRQKLSLVLHALLGVVAVVNAIPHDSRLHHHRDAGNQPVCVPISPVLRDASDLAAKTRPAPGVCAANEVVQSPNSNTRTLLVAADGGDDHTCTKDKPCDNGACCAKSGYCGFGPKYCGKTGKSPNDKCWSNCDAHAECGVYADPKGKECPLNVCCSQFGFCGMTEEFCDKGDDGGDDGGDDDDDEPTGCQSNCDQPGSGKSGSEVRNRVIGYYEVWNHKKKCINMGIDDVPVESLTHLYYSFGYIDPDDFTIVPMDDGKNGDNDPLSEFTFAAVSGLKKKNPDLKVVLAVGGWTFNDNHTVWQPVFSNMVSSKENREKFILGLAVFNWIYEFDGIDFDWEYPGAGDRGGHPDDGENFTKFLEELKEAFSVDDNFEISFTAPTSYWYLRHFDLKKSADAVDFVNLMSYDLHGIWDSNNPIGSHVLAHTNLTEIDRALDLLWRNDVDPSKVNMGLGFYGRSYQLADPACSKPGCLFKGGGTPGSCTDQSGILSYNEIMEIKDKYNLSPVHDEDNAVKYLTWNEDQWVSYDDKDTIQAKITFANNRGLGGVLIWAVDLDTPELDALAAVIYPKQIGFRGDRSKGADNWEELSEGTCYASDCVKKPSCKTGYIKVDRLNCGNNDWPLNRPDGEQALCCPVASAPDVSKCTWRGGPDFCNGQCHTGEVAVISSKWGSSGAYCLDGRKFFCCPTEVQQPICRWTDCDEDCDDNEDEMTWRASVCGPLLPGPNGIPLPPAANGREKFCCNKAQKWKNCDWHGKPGSCFDNHCDTGGQVALTTSYDGAGKDCGINDRKRTYCCDLPDDVSPFLPVPLDYLFPNAPDEDEVNTDFKLKVDPTWGGSEPEENMLKDEGPDEAPFGFIVMTSPPAVQQSLDKRDGSHWEVFDCFDAITIGEHKVRMTCTDQSEESNCGNIHWGHGAPGTIIQMPEGCGPGKYAVLKTLTPSENQTMPGHLARRGLQDTVYDLTFDYDFKRVPRDLGDTDLRIDYSNDVDYWDNIVDKAADSSKKRKRSLHEVNGNHRRWLEEEWRDDVHFGGVSHDDLHKRWFGKSILEWLKNIVGTVEKTVEFGHHFEEDYILKLVDQTVDCPSIEAFLDIHAETHVEAHVSYGFTVIAKLGKPIDLSDSYLYFRTKGEVTAAFVVDAAVTYKFDTEDVKLFSADRFGAAFTVPGIVTIGPNFEVFGQIEGQATLGVNFESRVKLADWDVEQTYPIPDNNEDYEPELEKKANKDGFQTPLKPDIQWSVGINGHVTAHIKPAITFGIVWDDLFFKIDSCAVRLVADGHVRFHASAETGSSGSQICYGIDAGADLYADIEAPSAIDWALPETPYYLVSPDDVDLFSKCHTPSKRSEIHDSPHKATPIKRRNYIEVGEDGTAHGKHLGKRAQVWGPLLPELPLGCPNGEEAEEDACPPCKYGDYDDKRRGLFARVDGPVCDYDPDGQSDEEACPIDEQGVTKRDMEEDDSGLERRDLVKRTSKSIIWEYKGKRKEIVVVNYPSCGKAVKQSQIEKWYGYHPNKCSPRVILLNQAQVTSGGDEYVTEHIYEAQTVKMFLEFLINGPLPNGYSKADRDWVSEVIIGLDKNARAPFKASGWKGSNLWEQMYTNVGSDSKKDGLVIAEKEMNSKKENFFGLKNPSKANAQNEDFTKKRHSRTAGVFWYMKTPKVWAKFVDASQGIEKALDDFDKGYKWGSSKDELGRPTGNASPGLRELYCYWIDKYLAQMEAKAATWQSAARANYVKKWPNTNWVKQFDKGDMQTSRLKFPKGTGGHGGSGTWSASNYKNLWTGPVGPF